MTLKCANREGKTLLKLLKRLEPIRGRAAAAVIFVVLTQLTGLLLPLMLSVIINNGIGNGDMDYIVSKGMLMIGLCAANVVFAVLNNYYSTSTSMGFGKILRKDIFNKVESLSQIDTDKIGTASLITRCTNDVKVLQDFILQTLRMIIAVPIMLVGGTVMAFILNAKLAAIIFMIMPIIAVICAVVIKVVMPIFKKRQKMTDELNRFLRQKLSGIRVIKAFNTTEKEDDAFSEKNNRLSALMLKFMRIFSVLFPLCITLVIASLDAMIYFAVKNIDALTDTVKIQNSIGDLQAFMVYMIMIIGAITMAASMFVIFPRANISAKRIMQVLEIEPMIKEPTDPKQPLDGKKGEVEFKNVCFGYGGEMNVLSDISFTAQSGKVTAIIGGTGSGKTTLLSLISRFYDADGGSVLFDGVDVRELSLSELRKRISYVSQKSLLFSGTIEDNLRFADENASDEKIRKALEIAQCTDFVSALPDGINSFVSQSGKNFSGGQKQRLTIARSLVRDAEVYIFDDSFSALDFRTDARLRKALKENISATVIIVAQRVGTIIDADKIIVLDEGKVVGNGTHRELMDSCDVYREIALSQLSQEALK